MSIVSSSSSSRLLLTKAVRRAFRTVRTEFRLFLARPTRRRPWTIPAIVLLIFSFILYIALYAFNHISTGHYWPLPRREETHFTHNVHDSLPPPATFDEVRSRACSWLYLEFGAKDGRHLDGFFTNGNQFLEEFLRATQSSMRAFCAVALEPDPSMAKLLNDIRNIRARKAAHFNVFTQIVPAATDGTEQIRFRDLDDADLPETLLASAVSLPNLVRNLTLPLEKSGKEVPRMYVARGNRNIGCAVLRFNSLQPRQALWYLHLLEASKSDGLLCTRVDRLILDFSKIRLRADNIQGDLDDRDVVREWSHVIPSNFAGSDDVSAVVQAAREINEVKACRARVHVLNSEGKMLVPEVISNSSVFYAILAGHPTFDERIRAQTETWMKAVPQDRLTIFTNIPRNGDELKAANGRNVAVVQPHQPKLELRLPLMQSWSHLVRLRESWDRTMKDNPEIKWLALVDDDTFVFPGGFREYLTMFDHRVKVWGGSGEQARIDNGDAGKFAVWLREIHTKHGGKHCYLRSEKVPRNLAGTRIEYGISEVLNGRRVARKVSHMCHDTFCKTGCPAVPQGAAIFVSRALVEALRPHIEQCEHDTAKLCKNCGSQRLFMCVNRYTEGARTLLTRGICRAPWKLEHREKFPFALTFHGFNRYRGMALSTLSLYGDMVQLWQLGQSVEEAVRRGLKFSFLIPMQQIANMIGCHGTGRYEKGSCVTKEGIRLDATDGKKKHDRPLPGHLPADRKGSA